MRLRRIEHDEVDSTSERAFAALAAKTARHGDVHLANAQTSGRGRRGREWWSPAGGGLFASLVLLPPPPHWNAAALTMAGGLAVLDAVRSLGLAETRLDWPNDVLAGEAKIAGILVETRGLEPHAPHYVVGVGLNVTQLEFPASLRAERRVASLRMLGSSVTVVEARDAVLPALAHRMDQVTADETVLESDYLAATGLEGRRVRVRSGDGTWIGMLDRISIEEGLVLAESRDSSRRFPLEIVREVTACL